MLNWIEYREGDWEDKLLAVTSQVLGLSDQTHHNISITGKSPTYLFLNNFSV